MKVSAGISVLLMWSSFWATGAQAQTATSDESAIRRALAGYTEARQRQDTDAQAGFYAADADFRFNEDGQIIRGRDEIEASLQSPVPAAEYRFTLDVEQIRFLSPTIALADAIYGGNFDGYALYVMVKEGDEWLIKAARVAGRPPPSR